MKLTVFFSATIFFLSFLSCNKDDGPYAPTEVIINETDTVSFSTQVQPIFNANCISCHDETHSKLNLQENVSYNELTATGFSAPYLDTSNADQSNIYRHLIGSLSMMPPSGELQDSNKDLILYWIDQGAANN